MGCNRRRLRSRQPTADLAHLAQRVIVALAGSPVGELLCDIGGGLTRERGIARTAIWSMAGCARRQAPARIARVIQPAAER